MSFTIEAGKETGLVQIGVTPKPLILCDLVAVDGDAVYLTTTPALGGATLTYNSHTYQARLLSSVIEQIQAQSPQGYDIPGSVTLAIADGDFVIWTNHANAHGWRGGALTVTFLLWDIPSNTYSTNSYVWVFILDKPDWLDGVITVAAQARQSMTRVNVPNTPRQNRCSHNFPSTSTQRADALYNPTSPYYACGYSPDQVGGIGNTAAANLTNPNGSKLTDASGYYVMCDYTRSCGTRSGTLTRGCMARLGNYAGNPAGAVDPHGATVTVVDGDITRDAAGHATARFDGDTFLAQVQWKGKQYTNPTSTQTGFNTPNPATGSTYYSQGYGTQWVQATVLEPIRDPNSYRTEAIVCVAAHGPAQILKVLVQGIEITQNNSDVLFTWRLLSPGGRQGAVSLDVSFYQGTGDPHGGLCAIEIVVPMELLSSGIADVRVLVQFPQPLHAVPIATLTPSGGDTVVAFPGGVTPDDLPVPLIVWMTGTSAGAGADGAYVVTASSPGSVTLGGSAWTGTGGALYYYPINGADTAMIDAKGAAAANPVWALLDLLTWGPFTAGDYDLHRPGDFDVATWYAAAQIAAVQIGYLDINGVSATHARYRCSLALTTDKRQSMAKAVLALRNCAGIVLARDPATGLLQCFVEQTLADQQGAPIAGSNYNTAVSSLTAADTVANGYLAYSFDGAGSIEKGTFKITGRSLNDTPNTVAFPFQDSANVWVEDSLTTIDEKGYTSSGKQEIEASIAIAGIENFDQGTRRANVELAKALYGNSRFDSGGTELISFRTTAKAAHLASRVGAICGVTYDQLGL